MELGTTIILRGTDSHAVRMVPFSLNTGDTNILTCVCCTVSSAIEGAFCWSERWRRDDARMRRDVQ